MISNYCKHGILWEYSCDSCSYEYDLYQTMIESEHYANLDSIEKEREDKQFYLENPDLCPHGYTFADWCDICDVNFEESVG